MSSHRILFVVIAIALAQACKHATPVTQPVPLQGGLQATSGEKTIATQNRINRYFHQTVIPKLGPCWQGIEGQGSLAVEFHY